MRDEVLVIFEENQRHKKENLIEYIQLNKQGCIITTLGEISQGNGIAIKDFGFVLDCTNDNKLFNMYKEKGTVLKKGKVEYFNFNDKNIIIVKGPSLSMLSGFNSQNISVKEKFEESFQIYNDCINFLISKNSFLRNKNSFQESSISGLIINDVINCSQKKIYKLVYSIPENKEVNTEYVSFENIEILKNLKEVIDGMVFL